MKCLQSETKDVYLYIKFKGSNKLCNTAKGVR